MTVRCDGAATAVGRVRRVNEDSYLMSPPLYAVADGMGGHGSGDVASALAIDALQARARLHRLSADVVLATLYEANRVIVEATPERGDAGGMGTTVATDLQLPASTGVFLAQSVTIALMGANNRRAGAAARPAAVPAPVSPGGTQGEPGSAPGPRRTTEPAPGGRTCSSSPPGPHRQPARCHDRRRPEAGPGMAGTRRITARTV